MRRSFSCFLMSLVMSLPFNLVWAADTYTLDPTHSYVMWHINHFGFSNPSGKWMADGTLTLDEINPQNSKVNVTIHVANIVTGIQKLDEHLRGPDFFNVAKFPTATFVSNKVDVINKTTAKVFGTLTVHGISKLVVLNVTLNKLGNSPISKKMTAGFTATTQVKRSEFGMGAYAPGLSDEVKLEIEVEAQK